MASLHDEWFCSVTGSTETLDLSETGGKHAKRQENAPLRVTCPLSHLPTPLQWSYCKILIRHNQDNAAWLFLFPHSKQATKSQLRCTPNTSILQVQSPAAGLENSIPPIPAELYPLVPTHSPGPGSGSSSGPKFSSQPHGTASGLHGTHGCAPGPQPKQSRARIPAALQTKTVLLSSSSCTNPCHCVSLEAIIRFVKEPCCRSTPRGHSSFG